MYDNDDNNDNSELHQTIAIQLELELEDITVEVLKQFYYDRRYDELKEVLAPKAKETECTSKLLH